MAVEAWRLMVRLVSAVRAPRYSATRVSERLPLCEQPLAYARRC
jgi:hypothetical protein